MKKSVLAAVAVVATLLAIPVAGADDGVEYYLSVGDSLAQGYQPIGGSPVGDGYNQGYPDQLLKLVRGPSEHLRLVKLGCGGETTTTMLLGGSPFCGYAGSQLAAATAFLRAHRGEVALVTIDIGGNDVLNPQGGGVAAIQANLPVILAELREAAGPGVPIVGMTYYSPTLPSLWFETHATGCRSTSCASARGRGCARRRRSDPASTRTAPATPQSPRRSKRSFLERRSMRKRVLAAACLCRAIALGGTAGPAVSDGPPRFDPPRRTTSR